MKNTKLLNDNFYLALVSNDLEHFLESYEMNKNIESLVCNIWQIKNNIDKYLKRGEK